MGSEGNTIEQCCCEENQSFHARHPSYELLGIVVETQAKGKKVSLYEEKALSGFDDKQLRASWSVGPTGMLLGIEERPWLGESALLCDQEVGNK
ncbi:hypothetical protein SDC9_114728 [bioreactor metagenome]|uniref:Uncharacterized protein n=1 Tax=bioreactor metagenome TaxID=1076179 RepID=A0A645BXG6_9ZZZZ